jgi:hypothetical protein
MFGGLMSQHTMAGGRDLSQFITLDAIQKQVNVA